jgi:transcriptional regulator of acetoin/glycerol metabolism
MKNAWKKFVLKGEIEPGVVRPLILESWKRCKEKQVYPFHKKCPLVISSKELEERLKDNFDLLDNARLVVNSIYSFFSGSGFVVMICDADGYVLERVGDEGDLIALEAANFREGACCSEDVLGTNAIGTCIIVGKPIQMHAYEHWSICVQIGTCSAAPIRHPFSREIIGVLDVTGPWDKVHPHTLGMVVAGVDAIENLMKSNLNYRKAVLADQNKTLIMESTCAGFMNFDNDQVMTHINGLAMKYLGIIENPIGLDIDIVFKDNPKKLEIYKDIIKWIESSEDIIDEFLNIYHDTGVLQLMGSAQGLVDNGNIAGRLITLQDISSVKKLAEKVKSKQAKAQFSDFITQNKTCRDYVNIALKAAKTNSNILILGESGTGKELFAQAIHNASDRAEGPFIAINCVSIPKDLLSSELFGYVGGAFTGAQKGGVAGKFEKASGGTLFLDEVGDMPIEMQATLLRVLQEKIIMRIGSSKSIPVDVRIIAATNKDLLEETENRTFRLDLYYRLNVISIMLPPLRERKEDIPLLIEFFTATVSKKLGRPVPAISDDFIKYCLQYNWPGNVRELQNIIERAIILSKNNILLQPKVPHHFDNAFATSGGNNNINDVKNPYNLRELSLSAERDIIQLHLEQCKYNKTVVAQRLGISRSTLYRKIKEHGL